ncbi:hypothetical protein GJU40_02075 [Bacillus lacus]|uniref:Uncharacterized protein n=1 Tax=Metabacillus lacus TaxID=1983721 RepID=A0A7X2LYS9_9BACI|nr:hypothetical protein [Metabacillus lacus]MRX70954.1 hypothetical protein [Metabacillus lacus]
MEKLIPRQELETMLNEVLDELNELEDKVTDSMANYIYMKELELQSAARDVELQLHELEGHMLEIQHQKPQYEENSALTVFKISTSFEKSICETSACLLT